MPSSSHYSSGGSSSYSSTFTNPWGSGGAGGEVQPGIAPEVAPEEPSTEIKPGVFGVDVTTPAGFAESMKENAGSFGLLVEGLGSALFGKDNGSLFGGVPGLGDVGRFAGEATSGITHPIGGLIQGTADVAGGALEHVAIPGLYDNADMQRRWDALPDEIKSKYSDQIAADPGAAGHYMYQALKENADAQQKVNPELLPYADLPRGSLADTLEALMTTVVGAPVMAVARGTAEVPKLLTGMNRLQEIAAIAAGGVPVGVAGTGIGAGSPQLNDVEAYALEQFATGKWSSDQAFDFLTAGGKAFSHADELNIAGMVAMDPTIIASLGAAALARLGMTGVRLVELSGTAARVAAEGGFVEDTLVKGGQILLRKPGSSGPLNVLGKAAESPRVLGAVQKYGELFYSPLQGTAIGKVAKGARYIIDPLHAIGTGPNGNKLLDTASNQTSLAVHQAHGMRNTTRTLELLNEDGLFERFTGNIATYSGNILRAIVAQQYRASMLVRGLGDQLGNVIPGSVMDDLMKAVPRSYLDVVKQVATSVRVLNWDAAAKLNLAQRMATIYGVRTAEEWLAWFAKNGLNDDMLGYLHAGSYGMATEDFVAAVGKHGDKLLGKTPLSRMVLLNATTLTEQGGRGLLNAIMDAAAASPAKLKKLGHASVAELQRKLITEAQKTYPSLGYVVIRDDNLEATISRFLERLNDTIESGVLPLQVIDSEIAKLPAELQAFYAKYKSVFGLGFRPEDDLLWGLKHDGNKWVAEYEVWVDHVAQAVPAYRPVALPVVNVVGQVIPGAAKAGRMVDILEAGSRTLLSRTTSATITEAARSRFQALATGGKQSKAGGALGIRGGLTEREAKDIFQAIVEAASIHKTSARGLRESDMWRVTEQLVPARLRAGPAAYQFTSRDMRNLVVAAYEGDLRFVGLTQKLTGRAKMVLAPLGGNVVGFVAEGLFPLIKYRLNGIFQLQERIEPIILNSGRGVTFVWGTKMAENDAIAAKILERMVETGIARISDIDMLELSMHAMLGHSVESAVKSSMTLEFIDQLVNVQGSKRVNLMRTWQHNLGVEIKPIFEQYQPGLWGKITDHYVAQAGHALTDDEVALRYLAQQILGGEVEVVDGVVKAGKALNLDSAISTAEWHAPHDLGSLRTLQLDFMAKRMAFPMGGGKHTQSIGDLRAALANKESGLRWVDVQEALATHGASPDYIRRVKNALDFHWDNFWRDVKTSYNLTTEQVRGLQNMMIKSAENRGMTAIDFMSQVYAPGVYAGKDAMLKSLEGAVNVLRKPSAEDIAAGAAAPSYDMLIGQLSKVFVHHLDPSMQRTLMTEFDLRLDREIADLAASTVPEEQARAAELMKVRDKLRAEAAVPPPAPAATPPVHPLSTAPARPGDPSFAVPGGEPGFVYHATDSVEGVRADGLKPQSPDYRPTREPYKPEPAVQPVVDISHLPESEQRMLAPTYNLDDDVEHSVSFEMGRIEKMTPEVLREEIRSSSHIGDMASDAMYAYDEEMGLLYDYRQAVKAELDTIVHARGSRTWTHDGMNYRREGDALEAAREKVYTKWEAEHDGHVPSSLNAQDELGVAIDRYKSAVASDINDRISARYFELKEQYGTVADAPRYTVRTESSELLDREPTLRQVAAGYYDLDFGRDLPSPEDPYGINRIVFSIQKRTRLSKDEPNLGWGYEWRDRFGRQRWEYEYKTRELAVEAAKREYRKMIEDRIRLEQPAAPRSRPAPVADPTLRIAVPARTLKPGHGKVYAGDARQPSGAPVRGDDVITWDDPQIPDTVYHVTTNKPAVEQTGVLRAGGTGGLGGDSRDEIVSMTISHDVAIQLEEDMKFAANLWEVDDPAAVLTAQADAEGWGARWKSSTKAYFKEDGTVADHVKYTAHDWMTLYYNVRYGATGKLNPMFLGVDAMRGVDASRIGIVEVPKTSLNNGALITNFDLGPAASAPAAASAPTTTRWAEEAVDTASEARLSSFAATGKIDTSPLKSALPKGKVSLDFTSQQQVEDVARSIRHFTEDFPETAAQIGEIRHPRPLVDNLNGNAGHVQASVFGDKFVILVYREEMDKMASIPGHVGLLDHELAHLVSMKVDEVGTPVQAPWYRLAKEHPRNLTPYAAEGGDAEKFAETAGARRAVGRANLDSPFFRALRDESNAQRARAGMPPHPEFNFGGAAPAAQPIGLQEIRSYGDVRVSNPSDKVLWEDGLDEPRTYWSGMPSEAEQYVSDQVGDQGLLRTRQDGRFSGERGTGQIVSRDVVPPEQIEYLGADKNWYPINEPAPVPEAVMPTWTEEHARAFAQEVLARVDEIRTGAPRATRIGPKSGKPVPVPRNPEVERAVRQFRIWSRDVIRDGLLSDMEGVANPYSRLVEQLTGIPSAGATPYNATEHAMMSHVVEKMRAKEEDAFMLQYFKRNRSFIERSVNHPVFGIYPASYMWGKIAPEMIRFIAKEPFGIKTGAMAKTFWDLEMSIATQREWDPAFDEHINKIGSSEMVWFLNFMVPAVPWDISAAVPAWIRDIAQQGLDNEARIAKGEDPLPLDLSRSLEKTARLLYPWRQFDQARGPAGELGDVLRGPEPESDSTSAGPYADPSILLSGPASESPAPISGPVEATDLQPILSDNTELLHRILSGQ